MRNITVTLYQYKELSEDAKEKARNWYREGYDGEFEWEGILEDAKQIGLIITSLDQHRANSGHFEKFAENTAERILENHGKDCETYKDAKTYLEGLKALKHDKYGDLYIQEQDKANKLESYFLHDILEDYRIMLEKQVEYVNSDEIVAESIEANEYEFTVAGDRA